MADRIDQIWHHLDFGSAWYSAKQRALAERMVRVVTLQDGRVEKDERRAMASVS